MPATIRDVAAYILDKQGGMTTMKLQKLCYYSQGWSLAWDGEPIFPEEFQAWANGPVSYDLFTAHRGQFRLSTIERGDPSKLNVDQRETVDAVLRAYGHLTGQQLSDMTHAERPWQDTRGDLPDGAFSNAVIENHVLEDYFGGLDSAARTS